MKSVFVQTTVPVIQPCLISYCEYPKGYVYPPETHDYYELVYIDSGSFRAHFGERETLLSSGEFVLYPPMLPHGITTPTGESSNGCCIGFSVSEPLPEELCCRVFRLSPRQRRCIADIYSAYESGPEPYGVWAASAEITRLLFSLMSKTKPAPSVVTDDGSDREITEMIDYINANPGAPNTLGELCRRFGMGKTALCRRFRESTGMTVHEAVNAARIRTAKELIRGGELNFTEAAAELGMNDVHYFSSWFRRHTGMTPTRYLESVKFR